MILSSHLTLYFHYQVHPQLNVVSASAPLLHYFWSYWWLPPTLPQEHIVHLLTWGRSGSSFISFHVLILSICDSVFSWQEYRSGLPFPPPVYCVLSELFAMTCLSWVALHGRAHSFTEYASPLPLQGCGPCRGYTPVPFPKSSLDRFPTLFSFWC